MCDSRRPLNGTDSEPVGLIHQRCMTDHLPTEPCPADDPYERYGTIEHEAVLIEEERQSGY